MAKWISCLAVLFLFLIPAVCLGAFTISLKNGSRIITKYYWEEGDQIKFYYQGGVIGIGKDRVVNIAKATSASLPVTRPMTVLTETKEETKETAVGEETAGAEEEKTSTEETAEAPAPPPPEEQRIQLTPEDEAHYKKLITDLQEEKKNAQIQLEEAIAAGDRNQRKAMLKKLQRVSTERSNLSLEIKKKTEGILPSWWLASED